VNDEGFREIQLNGKQLVFLFMAATVILVVSFLFGVLVGRGVHTPETVVQTAGADVVSRSRSFGSRACLGIAGGCGDRSGCHRDWATHRRPDLRRAAHPRCAG
jgi:hypothetical protein